MQVAEVLGIPAEHVRPVVGDTDSVGYTTMTGGSSVTFKTGWACYGAAEDVKRQMEERAVRIWEVSPEDVALQDGVFVHASDPELRMTFRELASMLNGTGGPITGRASVDPRGIGETFAVHIVDVEVDPETGKVDILRYTAVQDAGKAIHPGYVEGQIQGGASQGIGWALNEEYFFNHKGEIANASFLDYRMPTSLDLPMIDTVIVEVANPGHPYGARGVGRCPSCRPWLRSPTRSMTPSAYASESFPCPPATSSRPSGSKTHDSKKQVATEQRRGGSPERRRCSQASSGCRGRTRDAKTGRKRGRRRGGNRFRHLRRRAHDELHRRSRVHGYTHVRPRSLDGHRISTESTQGGAGGHVSRPRHSGHRHRCARRGGSEERRGISVDRRAGYRGRSLSRPQNVGKLPLEQVVEPAIALAEGGFDVSWYLSLCIGNAVEAMRRFPATADVFLPNDRPLRHSTSPPERLVQKDLAQVLRLIARTGPDGFYGGEVAAAIEQDMVANEGLITREDLASYQAVAREPAVLAYRGHDVLTADLPFGGTTLLQTLSILQNFDLSGMSHNSAEYLHTFVEAARHAFRRPLPLSWRPRLRGRAHEGYPVRPVRPSRIRNVRPKAGSA